MSFRNSLKCFPGIGISLRRDNKEKRKGRTAGKKEK